MPKRTVASFPSMPPHDVKRELAEGLEFSTLTSLPNQKTLDGFRKRIRTGKFIHHTDQLVPRHLKVTKSKRRLPAAAKTFSRIVHHRRSDRTGLSKSMRLSDLEYILHHSAGLATARPGGIDCVSVSVWVRRVQGLKAGFYLFDSDKAAFKKAIPTERLSRNFVKENWDAAAFVFIRIDPRLVVKSYGVRGFRFSWLVAGSVFAHIYLAMTALGLGCSGIGAGSDQLGLSKKDADEVRSVGVIALGGGSTLARE